MTLPRESSRCILFLAMCAASLFLLHTGAYGQWRKLADIHERLTCVLALDPEGKILVAGSTSSIYRSDDYGASWNNTFRHELYTTQFAFMDRDTGWASVSHLGSLTGGGCLKTTDGGRSWRQVRFGAPSAVFYAREIKRLFVSGWYGDERAFSDDFGETWTLISLNDGIDREHLGGFAFLNANQGIVSGLLSDIFYVTTDGGINWQPSNMEPIECWQPTTLPTSSLYVANSETTGKVIVSSDGGQSWVTVHTFDVPEMAVTGASTGDMHTDSCGNLYVQGVKFGFRRSQDHGITWEEIGGPSNTPDTRFFLENRLLLALDTMAQSTLSAGIWQYVGPPLALTIDTGVSLLACHDTSFSLQFAFSEFCLGAYPELLASKISGSNAFEIAIDDTRRIRGARGIDVHYSPTGNASDTTLLTLTFWTGNITFDTTIRFIGTAPDHQRFSLELTASKSFVTNDDDVWVDINADQMVQSAGLNSLTFNVEYYDDLFKLAEITSPSGAIINAAQRIGSKLSMPILLAGSDLSLYPDVPIVRFRLSPRLTDSTHTSIELTDVRLNGGDVRYANCKLSAVSRSASVNVVLDCGDPLMQRVMRGEKALEIKSITPNPTDDQVTIEWDARVAGDVKLEVYSVAGVLAHEEIVALASAGKPFMLDTRAWPSGAYTIRLSSGDEEATASVVKQ